jgi:hypothetical protein
MEEFNIREEQRLVPIVRHLTNRGAVYSKDFKDKAVDDILPRMVDEVNKKLNHLELF